MARVAWTPPARGDLEEIAAFIRQDSPDFADEFVEKIADAAARLADFPLLGRRVPLLGMPHLRELIFRNYRIIYEPREDLIVIVGVLHGARDLGAEAEKRGWNLT